MAQQATIAPWILLFFGLYSLSAGVGELRRPGLWKRMIDDFAESASMRFLTGILCLVMGAAVYLSNPWMPDDWMSITVTVLGAAMVVEGVLLLAFGDRFVTFATALMGSSKRIWPVFSCLLGIAMIAAAMMRF